MVRRLSLPVLLLLVAAALARDKPEEWLELRSPHFIVISNANEKQTRNVADQFERMRAVFRKLLPYASLDSGSPITIIAVKNEKDFRTLAPEAYLAKGQLKLAGLFLRGADVNFVLLRLDAGGDHPYEVVYHEYTHFLMREAQEWLPLWLNEGYAEFYQTTEFREKYSVLGVPSAGNIFLLHQNRLLPLTTLFAVDHTSPYYHEEDKGSIFYAESWALTHYLIAKDSQEKTTRLTNYAELVLQKVDPVTAATRAFGDLKQLQIALENYVKQGDFHGFKGPSAISVTDPEFKVRPLAPAQVAAVRAEFLAYNSRAPDARTLAESALHDDPNNVLARETLGYLEFRQGHREEARKWYDQAVKLDSRSYLAHYYFAVIALSGGHLESEDEAQVETSLRTAIKLNPSFAPAYDLLAVFLGMRHRDLQEAHMMSLRAMEIDPENVAYRLNAANVLMSNQRVDDAIRVIQGALKIATAPQDIARAQGALQSAEQYQAALESHRLSQTASASETQSFAEGAAGKNEPSPPPPEQPAEFPPRGPRRSATGTIRDVRCSSPARMEFTIESREGTIVLHADDYYKVQFSAAGFIPTAELHPCTGLEGMRARVEFVESPGRTPPGQITSVEVRK